MDGWMDGLFWNLIGLDYDYIPNNLIVIGLN